MSSVDENGRLRVALCQLDGVVGDLDGNVERISAALDTATAAGCDLAVFPELAISGYPPEDLLLKPRFVADCASALEKLAQRTGDCVAVIGSPHSDDRGVANAAAVCARGGVVGMVHKTNLPNYGVFDEERYFVAGSPDTLFSVDGIVVGISICEDMWVDDGAVDRLVAAGARMILNLNASPFRAGKHDRRLEVARRRLAGAGVPLVYVNTVGGQDSLVFDGTSFVLDAVGEVVARAKRFAEDVLVVDVEAGAARPTLLPVTEVPATRLSTASAPSAPRHEELTGGIAEIYDAVVCGTRDYVLKNGFDKVCIGLSGGIDSSVVAVVAATALGPAAVHGILMPSRHSSDHSVDDALALCENLGITHDVVSIEAAHTAYEAMFTDLFGDRDPNLTDENLQSRLRGVLLMAVANENGWLVLTTGNKSELAVGYSTLYGDTAGAFAVISDVWKLGVYELAREHNRRAGSEVIPVTVIDKAPSAELRPDQRDDQSLPPYEVLDPVLEALVEHDKTPADLVAEGHEASFVHRIARLVDIAEYKRRQSPLGPKVSAKAFVRDRRMPITNHYRGVGGR
ncbi:MAG: NAD+ synthase [Acidimicrobiales bacterium]